MPGFTKNGYLNIYQNDQEPHDTFEPFTIDSMNDEAREKA